MPPVKRVTEATMLKNLTLALTLTTATLLAACADNRDEAKNALKRSLSVGYEVEYGELNNYPGGVVCGEYNAIGRFNVREGLSTFIFRNGAVDRVPSDDDLAIFCSDDPAKAFQARFGIDSTDAGNATLAAVHRDLEAMGQALQQYRADNFIYPVTTQGLKALQVASEIEPTPPKFREGGYLDKIPVDPWDRPYLYQSEEVLRSEPIVYTLTTLGRDGVAGGSGEDADISSDQLEYLKHLAQL